MGERYPRIRVQAQSGYMLVREGLSLDFYTRRTHAEISLAVMQSLETYLRAVGPDALRHYADQEGDWQPLDAEGWEHIRSKLLERRWPIIHLQGSTSSRGRYRFEYYGRPLDKPTSLLNFDREKMVCAASFWLPIEYLEEHGPERVRELALELAAPLPFCSGNAGLSFHCDLHLIGVDRQVRKWCFRYPGMDVPDLSNDSMYLGTRVRGPTWLTFLGQPILGELGDAAGLRARLHSPDTTVQELDANRAVVTLGPWPEAGDTEQGRTLPAYRELARVLEPWLHQGKRFHHFAPDDPRSWERRFLD